MIMDKKQKLIIDIINKKFDEELRDEYGVTNGTMDISFLRFRRRLLQAITSVK